MERLINVGVDQARRVKRIVGALIEGGIVGERDDITVVLKNDEPKLVSRGKTTKIEVVTVFRDGEKGPIDTITDTYRVKFP